MKIENDRAVQFRYVMLDDAGEPIASEAREAPVWVLFGRGNAVPPAVVAALDGKSAGDRVAVTVPASQAYGERIEGWTQRVSKKHLERPKRLKVGSRAVLKTPEGAKVVTVLKLGSSVVELDMNHPLAGKPLRFDIEVLDVRAAEEEELAHGHVHAPGHEHH